jgi:hypothetical protein
LIQELDAAYEVLATMKETEEEMAKKEKALKRRASLVEAGLDDEAAEAAVAKFENLDDESFDSITVFLTDAATKMAEAKMPPALKEALEKKQNKEEDKEDAKKKQKASEEETVADESETEETAEAETVAEASDLDNVETDQEVNLAVAEEEEVSTVETTRAALVDFVQSRLQTK